ncbi:pilin [Vibrio sp. S17_S38]|uniref:pilin n=1 Tax=Vibrio sp. S17_S38 TaxID=2720229 RepID=UPI00168001AB|nr:pilin [Vibrio sp. S17_S38]MBD1572732.1 pilin [Vibrio sp. S17_S38]
MKKLQQGKKKLQQGFTLIELMIVVAVIGVLAAIAMPQYQKYIAKSEVASVLASLTGVKTNVEAYTVENGVFPNSASSADELGIPVITLADLTYAQNGVEIKAVGAVDAGTITVKFAPTGGNASALVAAQSLVLTRITKTGQWKCAPSSGASDDFKSLMPKTCKSN